MFSNGLKGNWAMSWRFRKTGKYSLKNTCDRCWHNLIRGLDGIVAANQRQFSKGRCGKQQGRLILSGPMNPWLARTHLIWEVLYYCGSVILPHRQANDLGAKASGEVHPDIVMQINALIFAAKNWSSGCLQAYSLFLTGRALCSVADDWAVY